jgi:hypothetical protein
VACRTAAADCFVDVVPGAPNDSGEPIAAIDSDRYVIASGSPRS